MATCFGLSYLKPSSGQQVTEFQKVKCAPNGIALGAHFTYWNSVTYWPEDGLG